jgi:hypothetical protein
VRIAWLLKHRALRVSTAKKPEAYAEFFSFWEMQADIGLVSFSYH